jgi:hypothetical protein
LAPKRRAQKIISRASRSPMMRGRYCVAPTVGQAPTRARLPQHRVVRGDDEVAPQRELVPATDAPAVDHGDHRDRHAADRHGGSSMRSFHMAAVVQVRRFMAWKPPPAENAFSPTW